MSPFLDVAMKRKHPLSHHSIHMHALSPHALTVMPYLAAINTEAYFGNEVRSQPSIFHLVLKREGAVIGV